VRKRWTIAPRFEVRYLARPASTFAVKRLVVELAAHLALQSPFAQLQREPSQRPVRLLHLDGDLLSVDGTLLDLPLPFGRLGRQCP
jgi:hypothetical protein